VAARDGAGRVPHHFTCRAQQPQHRPPWHHPQVAARDGAGRVLVSSARGTPDEGRAKRRSGMKDPVVVVSALVWALWEVLSPKKRWVRGLRGAHPALKSPLLLPL